MRKRKTKGRIGWEDVAQLEMLNGSSWPVIGLEPNLSIPKLACIAFNPARNYLIRLGAIIGWFINIDPLNCS